MTMNAARTDKSTATKHCGHDWTRQVSMKCCPVLDTTRHDAMRCETGRKLAQDIILTHGVRNGAYS